MNRLQHARRQKLSWTVDESPDTEQQGLLQLESRHNGAEPDAPRRQKRFRNLAILGTVLLGAAGSACLLVEQPGPGQDAPGDISTMSLAAKLPESSLGSNSTQSGASEAKANETPLLPAAPADVPAPVRVASVSATDLVSATPAPLPPITVAPASTAAAPPAKKAPEPSSAPSEAQPTPAAITMSAGDLDDHLSKADRALRSGDLAVARSFYGRVASAGDARGALGMARTYDDEVLKRLPVYGQKGNRTEVSRWNGRAQELGKVSNAR